MTTMPQSEHLNRSYTLSYDAWDRLVKVYDDYKELDEQTNEYDGLGRRIVRGGSHYYYNDSWQLVEERLSTSGNPLNQFVWHPHYIDALAVCYWDGNTDGSYGGTNEGAHYYCQDANYNVTAIANSSGSVLERYNYTPYGKVAFLNVNFTNKSTQSTGVGNTHFFTGRELDSETGMQLNRRRFYDAPLGRWVTRDSIEYGGGLNLYWYVRGMPTYYVDPLGTVEYWPSQDERPGVNKGDPRWRYPQPPQPPSGGTMVCCGDVRGNSCERQFRHCDLTSRNAGGRGNEKCYPVWQDSDCKRKLDDGTPCCKATSGQIAACFKRHPYSPGIGMPGSNCQQSTVDTIGSCCLKSSWSPNWYADARGSCIEGYWVHDLSGSYFVCTKRAFPACEWHSDDPPKNPGQDLPPF